MSKNVFLVNFFCLFFIGIAQAENITITVKSSLNFKSATGIVLYPNGYNEIQDTQIKNLGDSNWQISFEADKKELSEPIFASALITTEDDTTIFSPVISFQKGREDIGKIPSCNKSPSTSLKQSQIGPLKALIMNRNEQRNLAKKTIEQLIDKNVEEKLVKLEKELGLYENIRLSSEINPYTLLDRSFRLLAALQLLEARRQNIKRLAN